MAAYGFGFVSSGLGLTPDTAAPTDAMIGARSGYFATSVPVRAMMMAWSNPLPMRLADSFRKMLMVPSLLCRG